MKQFIVLLLCSIALYASDTDVVSLDIQSYSQAPSLQKGDTVTVAFEIGIPEHYHLYSNPLGPGLGKPLQIILKGVHAVDWFKATIEKPKKYIPKGMEDLWTWSYEKKATLFFKGVLKENASEIIAGTLILDGLVCKTSCITIYEEHEFKIERGSSLPAEMYNGEVQDIPFEISDAQSNASLNTEGGGLLSKSDNTIKLPASTTGKFRGSLMEQLNEFSIIGSEGGYLKSEAFLSFLEKPSGETKSSFANKSIWVVVLLILLGGIALNFTPCVLPMIPVTLAVIGAGSQAQSRSRGFLVGGVYGLAMALTYGILGLVVVLTGTQFGTLNANPIFNFAIAAIFVLLALGMFDVIHIDLTKYRKDMGQKKSSKGQLLPVFIMGVVAALLAGACVAPVVISVVLYSATLYGQGIIAGLLLPFLLGLGMALPWPFAGAGISVMPKPGNWMIVVRNIFGIFILGMALYYGYSGVKSIQDSQEITKASKVKSDVKSKIQWRYSLEDALEESRRTNTPIVIDFWATWCKNCIAMDKSTFQDDAVAEKMNSYIPVKFQAENPNAPETKKILDHFKIVGLPSYIILEPRQTE